MWYAINFILYFCTLIFDLYVGQKENPMIFQTFVLDKKIFQKCKAEKAQIVIIRRYSYNLKFKIHIGTTSSFG